nr:VWA domain-containing protein [Rhodospirillales bacterium]
MFTNFFLTLRDAKIPVSLREYLMLLEAMNRGLSSYKVDQFYYLARSCLVKDERNLDKFDQVFGSFFEGLEFTSDGEEMITEIPEEWLKSLAEHVLTSEEMSKIQAVGGFEKLMEELKKRLEEQDKRHEGGGKWIGTGGTSPYGANGYNPEGVRIGQKTGRHGRAVKVWDERQFKNLDDQVEIGTRNMKMALRRLRSFARDGAATELDLSDTISSTARNAGLLDIKMVPERHNTVKVLILFDIGGSMDYHIETCEKLFSAVRSEFKHLEFFYYHNCIYERLWKNNIRRNVDTIMTWDVLRTYSADYKLIFVGDATMGPYEITYPGGSVEHWNEEPGSIWINRMLEVYSRAIWLNPVPENYWQSTPTIREIKRMLGNRMYPLTLGGLDSGMRELSR